MSINAITVGGRLGRDAEAKETAGGAKRVAFSIANDRRIKRGDEWVDHTNWIEVTWFGNRAASLSRFLTKGAKVVVTGELRLRKYEGNDGTERTAVEIIATDVDPFCDGRASNESSFPKPEAKPVSVYSDEIPF